MNWRLKALVQNTVALLPSSISDAVHYQLQLRFGRMHEETPLVWMTVATELCERIERTGGVIAGASLVEIGTGWRINLPIALWLCGVDAVTTVDQKRLVRDTLVRRDLAFIAKHGSEVATALGARLNHDRLESLAAFSSGAWLLADLFHLCNIGYHAPLDSGRLPLDAASVDHHVSCAVMEHVPRPALSGVLAEAHRVLKSAGTSAHRIDLNDHFRTFDRSVSPINFLRYSERRWKIIAGNRYMFVNRLRVDDFVRLFTEAGFDVVVCDRYANPLGFESLRDPSFRVDASFQGKSESDLATTTAWLAARKRA